MMRNSGKLADLGQKNKDDIDMLSADEKHAINQKLWAEMDYPIQVIMFFRCFSFCFKNSMKFFPTKFKEKLQKLKNCKNSKKNQ